MKSIENLLPKLVIAPGFVLGFAFIYGLMIWNGVLSVTGSRMLPNYDEFVGLEQYAQLWDMDRWYVALKNLGIFSVLYVGGSMLLGMLLAIFLDQKDACRRPAAHDLPVPHGVVIHRDRHRLEMDSQSQPGPGKTDARPGLVEFPFRLAGAVRDRHLLRGDCRYLAVGRFCHGLVSGGLRGIDDSIIKAAQIDGASLPRIYWRIILPILRPVVFSTILVLSHLSIKSFDLVMALTAGGPGYATDVPATFMYVMSFNRGQIGLGAASATMMLATVAAIVVPYLYSELRAMTRPHDR
jgi:glucose/mannose transport system permease protein